MKQAAESCETQGQNPRARAPAPHRLGRKTKPPDLSVSGAGGCLYFYLVLCLPRLGLDDARRDEEDQLLVGGADALPLEQVAQVRDAAQQRYLLDVD